MLLVEGTEDAKGIIVYPLKWMKIKEADRREEWH